MGADRPLTDEERDRVEAVGRMVRAIHHYGDPPDIRLQERVDRDVAEVTDIVESLVRQLGDAQRLAEDRRVDWREYIREMDAMRERAERAEAALAQEQYNGKRTTETLAMANRTNANLLAERARLREVLGRIKNECDGPAHGIAARALASGTPTGETT